MILVIIIIPFVIVFSLLANETTHLYHEISKDENFYQNHVNKTLDDIAKLPVMKSFDLDGAVEEWKIGQSAQRISQGLLFIVQKAYQNAVSFVIWAFVMFSHFIIF
jgi:predicted PurR-regulated permease PerM